MMCTQSRTMDGAGMDEENGINHLQLHQTTYHHLTADGFQGSTAPDSPTHCPRWWEHIRYVVKICKCCRITTLPLHPFPTCVATSS